MANQDKPQGDLLGEGGEHSSSTPKKTSSMARIKARAQQVEDRSKGQLKIWADEIREAPNEALRCALFTARNKNQARQHFISEEVHSYGSGRVVYSGEELRQDDLDVWLQVLHFGRLQNLGDTITFDPTEMKKALKWGYGKEKTERLKTILTRLKATAVQFHSNRLGKGVSLSMIRRFEYADEPQEGRAGEMWSIALEPEIALLFGGGVYSTRIEWDQRLALSGNLSKWLHGFYSTHRDPHPLLVETLLAPTGTKVASKYKARTLLVAAHEELKEVGFISDFKISKKGLVEIVRSPMKKLLTED